MTTKACRNMRKIESRVAALGSHRAAVVTIGTGSDRKASETLRVMRTLGHPVASGYAELLREARAWRWGTCLPYGTHHNIRRTR